MKRPKQQQTGPLSFLNFFSRKPKSEPRPEKNVEVQPKEEVAITLTLSEHPEPEFATEDAAESKVPGGEGEAAEPLEDGAVAAAAAAPSCTDVLSLSSSSQDQQVDEHLEECPLCLLSQPRCNFPRLTTCSHRTCSDCLRQYLRIEISESRVGIACPQCPETLAPLDVRAILDDGALLERFEEYHLRRFLAADPDTRWCPAPDCSYAVIAYGCAECPKLSCGRDGCDTDFCYHCRQLWHPNQTCDQARRQRARHGSGSKDASALYVFNEEGGGDAEEIKPCPRCGAYIMKTNDGSCNRMNCTVCACQFCWLCMQEITDVHYLSPSGCTFWGKKPWSQTRKVLWQVGMLLGAPVVISLIAGIAIPVIIVGIPIYMGRKVHGRCKKNNISGSKHYLTVASGVMMSVFVSPVIAAVTVGVGVPLMLTYVYGVVPMSLCRNGWCRPNSESPDTHKIQLEDLASYLLFSHVVSDHWTAQSNPVLGDASGLQEVSVQESSSLPSTSAATAPLGSFFPKEEESIERPAYAQEDSQSKRTQVLPSRDGTNIEVRVEIETHRRGARQSSLSSVLSSRSLSAESLQGQSGADGGDKPGREEGSVFLETDHV
ncbi:E3 ubiquitin-protein ligase RNF19B [Nerophis ophidion]|uniref:E3 ubiquitin-protein ligase RNF19B n=1 Tax=Nerophis ophidion TaxID=159077 RepID=UPI002ADF892E|nr:E3 ubiquitin-protein ligase RNF19B [Nerophis ophidion]XP_061742833.1 E3 ubiquitin-protein ligase RNF19B [Nerophis ophidion]XP_061742834.1 E3 ubiquitin-protein ligase RNF19B [Nerophis ophidion]XP_061742835.1 E3 ubiquitin-protein ligase RNF19B [Nerophis ophidion]XP_061742836.1 E3 ubiquitin-protein ligase RNF19B [Nerophis ophidion]XP_061742839.1 E3 ubiquitin-protein ligase RNF19B [Nerophis ophidion]XP_061742840.1 E3 ubiquitin-protein ligase RNF19B [Nerophis ophidion]